MHGTYASIVLSFSRSLLRSIVSFILRQALVFFLLKDNHQIKDGTSPHYNRDGTPWAHNGNPYGDAVCFFR